MHLTQLIGRQLAVWALATAAVVGACGGKVDESSRTGTAVVDCNSFCNRMLAARCPNDDLAQCLTDCNALPSQICTELYDKFLDCAVHSAKYLCAGDHASMQGCDTEAQQYLVCVNTNLQDAGGKDGAGGS